jgi:hypothetical protein
MGHQEEMISNPRESVMKRTRVGSAIGIMSVAALFGWVTAVGAQTFSSGSNGTLGAFAPGANATVTLPPDGVLNYTTINIPTGVIVSFTPNAANTPVTMLATGDAIIAGTLNLNGGNGLFGTLNTGPVGLPGGIGGPGGFAGGTGGLRGITNTTGSPGLGPGGGVPSLLNNPPVTAGAYGAPANFFSLLPLFGGSGGAGKNGDTQNSGSTGGGGGGALVLASSTKITIASTGSILANGGNSSNILGSCGVLGYSGQGSGGAIRLVAPELTNSGIINAKGGTDGCFTPSVDGRVRLEAFNFGPVALTVPFAFIASPGPITASSIPALVNLPTLAFTSVGGVAPPVAPIGSFTTADVTLPPTTTNPVPVTLTATNTPAPTTYTVKLLPQFAIPVSQTVSSSGSFAISTATANVTFPNGRISALQAFAGFTLTASLAPMIDGEPADQVLLAAGYGEPSTLTLVTKSGKEIPVSELSHADQLKVAQAFASMRTTTN